MEGIKEMVLNKSRFITKNSFNILKYSYRI